MKYLTTYLRSLKSWKSPSNSRLHKVLHFRKKFYNGNSKRLRTDLASLTEIFKGVTNIGQSDTKILKDTITKFSERVRFSQEKISEASNKLKHRVNNAFNVQSASKDPSEKLVTMKYAKKKRSVQCRAKSNLISNSTAQDNVTQTSSSNNKETPNDSVVERLKWYGRRMRFAEWRRKSYNQDVNPSKLKKKVGPTIMLVASPPRNQEGFLMYNDQLGRNFCGSLKNLRDSEKFKEVCGQQENWPEDGHIDIPPGVKSKITLTLAPNRDCESKFDATVKLSRLEESAGVSSKKDSVTSQGENISMEIMSNICILPPFVEEGANSMCNLSPNNSLSTSKHPLLGGVVSQITSAGQVNNSLRNLKKYWERIWEQSTGSEANNVAFPLTSVSADTLAFYMPAEDSPKIVQSTRLTKVPKRDIGTGSSSDGSSGRPGSNNPTENKDKKGRSDESDRMRSPQEETVLSQNVSDDSSNKVVEESPTKSPSIEEIAIDLTNSKATESGSFHRAGMPKNAEDLLAELESPNLMSPPSSNKPTKCKDDGDDFCSPARRNKRKTGSKGKRRKCKRSRNGKKDKRKNERRECRETCPDEGRSRDMCSSGACGSGACGPGACRRPPVRRDSCKPPSSQDAIKEFFTNTCFWIRNSGAINVLLAVIFGTAVYWAFSPKKEDDDEKGKDQDKKKEKPKNGNGNGKPKNGNGNGKPEKDKDDKEKPKKNGEKPDKDAEKKDKPDEKPKEKEKEKEAAKRW